MAKKNQFKQLSIKHLEEVAEELFKDSYPKYIGNGLYKIAPNCITGKRGLELYYKELNKQIKSQNDEI